MRVLSALALILMWGATAQPSVAAGLWTASKTERVDDIVHGFLAGRGDNGPSAISVGVSVDGALIVASGWGEAQPGVRAGADTQYQIGSLTKQFTAAALLTLMEADARNKSVAAPLRLDRPLRELFDGAPSWEFPGAPPLTVRSLLTMTSNLPNFTAEPPAAVDPWGAMPADRLLGEVKKLTPRGWPNSFAYSNTSYFLLSEILELRAPVEPARAGDSHYRAYLRSQFFAPAGMTRTGFASDAQVDVATPTYRRRARFGKPDWFKGSGDIVSTVHDMFLWNKALMEGGPVSHDVREAMFTSQAPITPVLSYGMGVYVERAPGLKIYSHSGTVPGYTAFNAILVEDGKPGWIGITVLTNSDGIDDLQRLADALAVVALE